MVLRLEVSEDSRSSSVEGREPYRLLDNEADQRHRRRSNLRFLNLD